VIFPRSRQAGNEPTPNRVRGSPHHDGDGSGGILRGVGRGCSTGHDHIDLELYQLFRQLGEALVISVREAVLDKDIPAFDPAVFV
jgi:hypothetical protein